MKNLNCQVLSLVLAVLAQSSLAFASGSVSYEEAAAVLPGKMRMHLDETFIIPEIGDASRLGNHYSALGGARVGPYSFVVTSRSSEQALLLKILTEVTFYDADEKPTDDPGAAKTVSEKFYAYEVSIANEAKMLSGNAPLSEGERSTAVSEARAVYNEVNELPLETRKTELENDERWGSLSRGTDANGKVRRAKLIVGEGDHGASTLEGFFDSEGVLRFVLWEDSSWSFVPNDPNTTIDSFGEYRFYFSKNGRLAQVLEKSYSGTTEKEISKAREKAINTEMDPNVAPSPWPELNQLSTAPARELLDLLEVLADYRLSFTPD